MTENDELEKRGRGRPKKRESYDRTIKARVTEDEYILLHDLESEFDISTSEVIRRALRTYHNIKMKYR